MSSVKDNAGRSALLKDWHTDGGVMLMGYEMFRNLSQLSRVKNKKQKIIFTETLLNPGECTQSTFGGNSFSVLK
jgi:transcriptional regulator ATRX